MVINAMIQSGKELDPPPPPSFSVFKDKETSFVSLKVAKIEERVRFASSQDQPEPMLS